MDSNFSDKCKSLNVFAYQILQELAPGGRIVGSEYEAASIMGGQGKSFKFNIKSGQWSDFAEVGLAGSDIVSFVAKRNNISQFEALEYLESKFDGVEKPKIKEKKDDLIFSLPPKNAVLPNFYSDKFGSPSAVYEYRNIDNNLCFFVARYDFQDKKDILPFSYTIDGKWVKKIWPDKRPMFQLHEILLKNHATVVIVEGEKSAIAAKEMLPDYAVVSWSGGVNAIEKTNWEPLKGKKVKLWPDADRKTKKKSSEILPYLEQPGVRGMMNLAEILLSLDCEIQVIDVGIDENRKDGWDAADALDEGWNQARFEEFISQTGQQIKPDVFSEKYETYKNGFYFVSFDSKGNETQNPDYDGLAHFLKNEMSLKCDESLRYYYDGKKYVFLNNLGLKTLVNKYLKGGISAAAVAGFASKAEIICYSDLSNVDMESGFLNCNNGVLNVLTGELLPHSHEKFFKYVLDHDYNPEAKCPTFMNSLGLITKGDRDLQKLIQQVFGYCIEGGHPRAEKFFVFLGGGGNGKSTILNALRSLIGLANISNVPVSLLDRPFSAISFDGKLANISDETPKFSKNAEILKNMVTGGYVRAAHKGMDEIDLKCNARLIFACNKPPNFGDDSDGMSRRIITIPFTHKIEDVDADRNIGNKLKAEMSGILNWALAGLKDLIENDYKFIIPQSVMDANEDLKRETDSAYDFIKEYIEYFGGPNGEQRYEKRSDIYAAYSHHCRSTGVLPISAKAFGSKLNSQIDALRIKDGFGPIDRQEKTSVGIDTVKIIRRVELKYKMPVLIRTDEAKINVF